MAAASESNSDQRLRRALLAHVRQDFSAPVGAIVGFAEILLDEAPRYGLERLAPDLERIHQAGLALQQLVDGLLDPHSLADRGGAGNDEAFRSRLRHDLRTPMNAVKGYGEMLLEDVVAAEATAFVRDLEKMLAAAKRLLVRIDSLVDFAESGAFAAADAVSAPGRSLDRLSHLIRPVPAESGPATATDPCRILVVDDHQSSRDLLARHLTRDGHDVVTAEDGKQGLKLAEGGAFDLVLLDLLMPRMSGYEVLCRLKSDSRYGGLPVIMISALDEIDSVVRCIEVGAEDYLPKPFDAVLLARPHQQLPGAKAAARPGEGLHASSFAGRRRSRRSCSSTSCRSRSWPASSAARRSSPIAFPTQPSCLRTWWDSPSCRLVCRRRAWSDC